jgi:hypothetical protein
MSSDAITIKQIAARVLSIVKNQYPDYYNDSVKKEQLVKTILVKIDSYSKYINPNNANKITQTIIKEIFSKNHQNIKPIKSISGPHKPKVNNITQHDYMLNSDYDDNPQISKMSQVQFDRNNLSNGRPNMMSQRPKSSGDSNNNISKSVTINEKKQQVNQMNNQFIPIDRNYEDFNNDYNINKNEDINDKNDQPVENRYEKMLKDRQTEMGQNRQRPSTPDFSLDGSGKKIIKEGNGNQNNGNQNNGNQNNGNQNNRNQNNGNQNNRNQNNGNQNNGNQNNGNQNNGNQNNGNKHDFTHNPQAQYGIIGSNELLQNNIGFSSFDGNDDEFSNINIMNTGIDQIDTVKFDDSISIDDRLRILQNKRDKLSIDNSIPLPPDQKTSVKEDNKQYISPPIKTNIRDESHIDNNSDLYSIINDHISYPIPQQVPVQQQVSILQQVPVQQQVSIPQQVPVQQQVSIPQQVPIQQQQQQQQQQQNQLLNQLIQQQQKFQDEMLTLKNSIQQQNPIQQHNQTNINNQELIQQYQEKTSELEQYKQINIKLQDRIIELQKEIQNNINNDNQSSDDIKTIQLQKIKEETMNQIQNMKKIQEDIVEKVNINKNIEMTVKKLIIENTSKFSNSEETIFLNNQSTVLSTVFSNVTSIELRELDLQFDKYNININNNKLHFVLRPLESNNNIDNNIDINTKKNDNTYLIDSETECLVNIIKDKNNIELNIVMGNYTIDNLVNLLNEHLKIFDIESSYNKISNIITFKSKNYFDLIFGSNTLLYSLGFSDKDEYKYMKSNKYNGTKAFNLKIDRCMNIYLSNINNDKPVMQYIINQNVQLQSKKIIFNPIISELSEINLKFFDSKNKEFKFDSLSGLDFGLQVIIKYISTNQNVIKNDLNEISSEDIFTIVKESIVKEPM